MVEIKKKEIFFYELTKKMSYVKVDDMVIAIFDGSDYSSWKKRILKFLELKKCKEVATREKVSSDGEPEIMRISRQ